jgi:hypothetical protein
MTKNAIRKRKGLRLLVTDLDQPVMHQRAHWKCLMQQGFSGELLIPKA